MASQVVTDVRCQRLMHRGSQSYHRRRNHAVIQPEGNFKEHNMGHEEGANKLSTKLRRQQAQKLHRLGFSYLASSFLYVVTKVNAIYNGFIGDVASESRRGIEVPITEAYFSVPVLPN